MLTLALLLAGLTVTLLAWSLLPTALTVDDRLAVRKGRLAESARQEELTQPFSQRVIMPWFAKIGNRLIRATPGVQIETMEGRLEQAGWYGRQPLIVYLSSKAILAMLLGVSGTVAAPLVGMVLAVVGYLIPDLLVRQAIRARQQQIVLAMPDAMDLMAVSVEAGLTLDGALHRLAAHQSPATRSLCQEIRYFLKDIQLGRSRKEAFRELGSRAGVTDLKLLTTALYQAEAWGVEMAKVMRVQADHLRTRRLQRAEERAMKAPIKILFPLAFCIFPAIFVVLLGPAGLRMMILFN